MKPLSSRLKWIERLLNSVESGDQWQEARRLEFARHDRNHGNVNMNIGFVGVGRMGANMARRLADCGFHVTAVYDVNRAAATKLAGELGCAACQDLSEVTAESDVIITVVSDDAAMRQIFAKSGDSLLVNSNGKLFINCATITPRVHLEVEELAGKAGARSLEACMASSITQARDGSLYLMCGGKEKRFAPPNRFWKSLAKLFATSGKRRSGEGKSAGQHGDEHQYRWPG